MVGGKFEIKLLLIDIDFFNKYVMGILQMLTGFYYFIRLLQKKVRFYYYLLFLLCSIVSISFIESGRIAEFGAFILLLAVNGIFVCHSDWKSVILYAVLTAEIMQLCYGIVNSLLSILYPFISSYNRNVSGVAFMMFGNMSLLLAAALYYAVCRYFTYYEMIKKQYVLMVFIPILMIFFMEEYINYVMYSINYTDGSGITAYKNYYPLLVIQLFAMAGLICILAAYKKLLQSFRLSTELSLLRQEEHFLKQYVEEAKSRYEKTKSFRHDVKNHITVIKELLQKDNTKQALNYITDMEGMTEELSFPCSTNNPAADILIGNKLGIAKSMGIDVSCSLTLPYPCNLRDIDFCIILSNALDNAIQACKRMDRNAEKYIYVTGHIQGDFILLEFKNSVKGNGRFHRGTGLSNIKAAAEKYNGAMNVKMDGTNFILSVLLIIP